MCSQPGRLLFSGPQNERPLKKTPNPPSFCLLLETSSFSAPLSHHSDLNRLSNPAHNGYALIKRLLLTQPLAWKRKKRKTRPTRLAVWPTTLPQTLPAVPALWNPARTTRGTDKDYLGGWRKGGGEDMACLELQTKSKRNLMIPPFPRGLLIRQVDRETSPSPLSNDPFLPVGLQPGYPHNVSPFCPV